MIEDTSILIVENDNDNAIALSALLRNNKAKVHISNSHNECINYLQNNIKPQIILLDLMMPYKDGYETLHEIRNNEKTKNIPVIIITAIAQHDIKQKCLEAGANDFFVKPFDTFLLMQSINKHINFVGQI